MKKRFTEEQIVKIVNRSSHGESAKDLAREIGVSPPTATSKSPSHPGKAIGLSITRNSDLSQAWRLLL
jgi:hypothetical protein